MKWLKTLLLGLLFLLISNLGIAQEYTLVAYNVENLFDADGVAVFDDYRPTTEDGKDLYTKEDVLTKIEHIITVLQKYNEGKGPDVIIFNELESDFTDRSKAESSNAQQFIEEYAGTSLRKMLGGEFSDEVKDLPSELLLLKGMWDAGLDGYQMEVGYNRLNEDGEPEEVQKNVIMSRLPIRKEKTKIHYVKNARPILEVWLDVQGHDLAVFANHWKSGAGSAELEQTRIQNATVLKNRLDVIRNNNPHVDFVLGGDFNSDYNQLHRYDDMDKTGVNSVLNSVGDERRVATGSTGEVYNLWYDYPIDQRGSDAYRGYWGTLMQLMISNGLYDFNGIQYVDQSFDRGQFIGLNAYQTTKTPIRWASIEEGYGYSDHFPVSMKFRVTDESNPTKRIKLENPGTNDNDRWSPIPVTYEIPEQYFTMEDIKGKQIRNNSKYYDAYFHITAPVTEEYNCIVNGEKYKLYSPTIDLEEELEPYAGSNKSLSFYGKLLRYRGTWEFVIEDKSYLQQNTD